LPDGGSCWYIKTVEKQGLGYGRSMVEGAVIAAVRLYLAGLPALGIHASSADLFSILPNVKVLS